MPNNPSLLVVLASFMLEARADGQGARTQLQLAQKNKPSLIETYSIYACQQLAKKLQPGEGLACVLRCLVLRRYWVVMLLCCAVEACTQPKPCGVSVCTRRWRRPGPAFLRGVPEKLHRVRPQPPRGLDRTEGVLEQPAEGHHFHQGPAGVCRLRGPIGLQAATVNHVVGCTCNTCPRPRAQLLVQANVKAMEAAEQRATAVYRRQVACVYCSSGAAPACRPPAVAELTAFFITTAWRHPCWQTAACRVLWCRRVMERYPGNSKLMKVSSDAHFVACKLCWMQPLSRCL